MTVAVLAVAVLAVAVLAVAVWWHRRVRRRLVNQATRDRLQHEAAIRSARDGATFRAFQRDAERTRAHRAEQDRDMWEAVALRHLRTANDLRRTVARLTRQRRRLKQIRQQLIAENERLVQVTVEQAAEITTLGDELHRVLEATPQADRVEVALKALTEQGRP